MNQAVYSSKHIKFIARHEYYNVTLIIRNTERKCMERVMYVNDVSVRRTNVTEKILDEK